MREENNLSVIDCSNVVITMAVHRNKALDMTKLYWTIFMATTIYDEMTTNNTIEKQGWVWRNEKLGNKFLGDRWSDYLLKPQEQRTLEGMPELTKEEQSKLEHPSTNSSQLVQCISSVFSTTERGGVNLSCHSGVKRFRAR